MIESLSAKATTIFLPEIFFSDQKELSDLVIWKNQFAGATVLDLFEIQKKELFKVQSPQKQLNKTQLNGLYADWTNEHEPLTEGTWVYYPWLNKLLHILGKEEFIRLRTTRNCYKISPTEQQELSAKTIGIIGLSVGHAVALTLATERTCGKMRLADFDSLELSNLNRIKTGLQNIGLNKAIVTAREIAEIDPFIEIQCYTEGLTEDNIDAFLLKDGKLDILIDECDSIDMKIFSRQKAKAYKIPVVMETSDRGMLDVERYDLEEDRPVMHGLLEGVPLNQLKNLTTEQKIPLVLKIADIQNVSVRGKVSMLEVGQSISTWPQLASAVTLGGAVVTDVCRRILLQQYHESGRYYVDIEGLAGNKATSNEWSVPQNPYPVFDSRSAFAGLKNKITSPFELKENILINLVEAANQAPSNGNDQPWKWIFNKGTLYLLHDRQRSFAYNNYQQLTAYTAFGAAAENLLLQSKALGLSATMLPLFEQQDDAVVATFQFSETTPNQVSEEDMILANQIYNRSTNRNPGDGSVIPSALLESIADAITKTPGVAVKWITDKQEMLELGTIIGECDRQLLLHPAGHNDFMQRDLRWTPASAEATRDGIDVRTLSVPGPMMAVLNLLSNPAVALGLKKTNTGIALVNAAINATVSSSAILIITVPSYSREDFFGGGRAMERGWLKTEALGFAVHPVNSPFFLFSRLDVANGEGLEQMDNSMFNELRLKFLNVTKLPADAAGLFICKISNTGKPQIRSLRLPVAKALSIIKE